MDYLQTHPGEDDETAWRRLKPKLSVTGRQLDEVLLMMPSAVPATGGATVPAAPAPGDQNNELFPGNYVQPPGQALFAAEPNLPAGGGIFGGGSASAAKPRISLSNPPTSPLNLIGRLEGWGIGPATQVAEVTIKVSSASGAQLKEVLKKLPDGMTFELSLEKDDSV